MWKEAEETFCAGHECAEKCIHVDIFQWNKISWVCKFHSYHISTRPGGCNSADLTFQHAPLSGSLDRTWGLTLQSDGGILRITSRLKFMITTPGGGLHSSMFIISFLSMPPITSTWDSAKAFIRKELHGGTWTNSPFLWQTTWQRLMLFGFHLIHTHSQSLFDGL